MRVYVLCYALMCFRVHYSLLCSTFFVRLVRTREYFLQALPCSCNKKRPLSRLDRCFELISTASESSAQSSLSEENWYKVLRMLANAALIGSSANQLAPLIGEEGWLIVHVGSVFTNKVYFVLFLIFMSLKRCSIQFLLFLRVHPQMHPARSSSLYSLFVTHWQSLYFP